MLILRAAVWCIGRVEIEQSAATPMGTPVFHNSFGTLFSTPSADIWGGMAARESAAELGSAAQTSSHARTKEWRTMSSSPEGAASGGIAD